MNATKAPMILACALLCATAGHAYAADSVSFRVPLDVKSYPVADGTVDVWCELRTAQGQAIEANGVGVKLVGGATSGGFVEVKVHYSPQEAANIRTYRCALLPDGSISGMPNMNLGKSIPLGAKILKEVGGQL